MPAALSTMYRLGVYKSAVQLSMHPNLFDPSNRSHASVNPFLGPYRLAAGTADCERLLGVIRRVVI